jgi:alkaline phosphatase D
MVLSGEAPGHADAPSRDFTYHVPLDGRLSPGRIYFFRFTCRSIRSRTGRCRTLPVGSPGKLKLAVVTCNDFTNGFFAAFAQIALDATVDFVVHLGDLIYETTGDPAFQKLPFPDRTISLPSGESTSMGLGDYRALYKTYRSDPLLQMASEFHTWITIWDDHETANDCYWNYARDTLGAPDHPYQTDPRYGSRSAMLLRQLKLDAQRAWSEYVPTTAVFDRTAGHPHRAMKIYRSFQFGDLLDLFMTDERTYRSPHPCGEDEVGGRYFSRDCPQRDSPSQTMLGVDQRDWLIRGITGSSCIWKGWGNEVFLGELTLGHNKPAGEDRIISTTDSWDGYAHERRRILESFREAGVFNFVALTGDLHTMLAAYAKIDYAKTSNDDPANVVGVEFMTPAVTSSNFAEMLGVSPKARPWMRGLVPEYFLEGVVRTTNPHITFFNSDDWGYATAEFTRDRFEWIVFKADKTANSPFSAARAIKKFRVASGSTKMVDIPV